MNVLNVCVRSVLGAADADTGLKQYSCCLLYQCLLTDSRRYTQQLVHADDSSQPLMCTILSYLVVHDCEWGSVISCLFSYIIFIYFVCFSCEIRVTGH